MLGQDGTSYETIYETLVSNETCSKLEGIVGMPCDMAKRVLSYPFSSLRSIRMVSLHELLETLKSKAVDTRQLLLSQVVAFLLVCTRLINNILLLWPSTQLPSNPPLLLPDETVKFLHQACNMTASDVEACWSAVSQDVWSPDAWLQSVQGDRALQGTFKAHGGQLYREY
jgi:hypothetical protein